jgi:hypothetical protein
MNADLKGAYPNATVTNHILQKATSGILPDPNGWWMSAAAQQVRRRLMILGAMPFNTRAL